MPTVRWSNGRADRAVSWEHLEDQVRHDQWWELDPEEFRQAMQKRAWRWSHTRIVTAGSSEQFFAELARAGLVEIIEDHDDMKEKVR